MCMLLDRCGESQLGYSTPFFFIFFQSYSIPNFHKKLLIIKASLFAFRLIPPTVVTYSSN